jgi:hypothetical protein
VTSGAKLTVRLERLLAALPLAPAVVDEPTLGDRVEPGQNGAIGAIDEALIGGCGIGEHGLGQILRPARVSGPPAKEAVDLVVVTPERPLEELSRTLSFGRRAKR